MTVVIHVPNVTFLDIHVKTENANRGDQVSALYRVLALLTLIL